MPVLPTYQAPVGTGQEASRYISGLDAGQSLMERADANRRANQASGDTHQMMLARLIGPVAEAKDAADIATANATIANKKRELDLRTQAATASVDANQEFLDANQLANWDEKANAMAAIGAKYAWMETLPEYKGFLSEVERTQLQAHGSAIANAQLDERLAQAQESADARKQAAQLAADTRLGVAETNAASRTDVAQIRADTKTPLEKQISALSALKDSGADPEALQALRTSIAKGSGYAPQHVFQLEAAITNRDEALRSGDTATAQIYQDNINKLNTAAGDNPGRALPTAPPARREPAVAPSEQSTIKPFVIPGAPRTAPAESAPVIDAPKEPAVKNGVASIDGKNYPISRDAKGNRAYLKDGKWYEIHKD